MAETAASADSRIDAVFTALAFLAHECATRVADGAVAAGCVLISRGAGRRQDRSAVLARDGSGPSSVEMLPTVPAERGATTRLRPGPVVGHTQVGHKILQPESQQPTGPRRKILHCCDKAGPQEGKGLLGRVAVPGGEVDACRVELL